MIISCFSLSLLLASCKSELQHSESDDLEAPEIEIKLPLASHASKSSCCHRNRVFLTLGKEGYHVENYTTTADLPALYEILKKARHEMQPGHLPLIYLISPPDLPFSKVSLAVRAASKAGFADIFFVSKRKPNSGNHLNHGILLQLPVPDGSSPPAITPVFIKANAQGDIFIHTGAHQELLDVGSYLRHFPKLNERLDVYCAAARAGGLVPHAQVYIEPKACHQRAIDILNALHSVGIKDIVFTNVSRHAHRTCQGMGKGKAGTETKSPSAIPRPPVTTNLIKR